MKILLSACFKVVNQGCARAIGRISGFSKQGQPTNLWAKDSNRITCLLSLHMAHLSLGHPFFFFPGISNWFYYFFNCCFFSFIFISCRLITLQYCSGFCHTLTWISQENSIETSILSRVKQITSPGWMHGSPIFNRNHSFSSVQFSHSVMSDSLRPHGLQHGVIL